MADLLWSIRLQQQAVLCASLRSWEYRQHDCVFEVLAIPSGASTALDYLGWCKRVNRSPELREFLAQVNAGLPQEQWQIQCIRFAPHAPEQNPVEDIWLQAKQFLRKFFILCKSFAVVKYLFEFALAQQRFTFEKAFMYG